jgi:hypothetical protein
MCSVKSGKQGASTTLKTLIEQGKKLLEDGQFDDNDIFVYAVLRKLTQSTVKERSSVKAGFFAVSKILKTDAYLALEAIDSGISTVSCTAELLAWVQKNISRIDDIGKIVDIEKFKDDTINIKVERLIYRLGNSIIQKMNSSKRFLRTLCKIARSLEVIQIYVNLIDDAVSFKITNFSDVDSKYKFTYRCISSSPQTKGVGFGMVGVI